MPIVLPKQLVEEFCTSRFEQGAYGMVNAILKNNNISIPKSLQKSMNVWNCKFGEARCTLVDFMTTHKAIIASASANQYAIMCVKKNKETTVRMEFLKDEVCKTIKNTGIISPVSVSMLEELLPSLEIGSKNKEFKEELRNHAYKIVKDHMGSIYIPSSHSLLRWAERVHKVLPNDIEKYVEDNQFLLQHEVSTAFNDSAFVWNHKKWGEFYHHSNLDLFFVADGVVIVTLYNKDFGFSPTINRTLTRMQLTLIKREQKKIDSFTKVSEDRLAILNAKINKMQDQLNRNQQSLKVLTTQRDLINSRVSQRESKFEPELKKLFRPI